eukprot:11030185-Lingulodinium_polyedra.AAC.1
MSHPCRSRVDQALRVVLSMHMVSTANRAVGKAQQGNAAKVAVGVSYRGVFERGRGRAFLLRAQPASKAYGAHAGRAGSRG